LHQGGSLPFTPEICSDTRDLDGVISVGVVDKTVGTEHRCAGRLHSDVAQLDLHATPPRIAQRGLPQRPPRPPRRRLSPASQRIPKHVLDLAELTLKRPAEDGAGSRLDAYGPGVA
jgi:hypothetical protein